MEQPLYFTPIDMYAPAAALVTLAGIRRTGQRAEPLPCEGLCVSGWLVLELTRGLSELRVGVPDAKVFQVGLKAGILGGHLHSPHSPLGGGDMSPSRPHGMYE